MNFNTSDLLKCAVGCFLLGALAGAGIIAELAIAPKDMNEAKAQINELRAEAIKRNAAEWIVDPATGETTFTWKPIP